MIDANVRINHLTGKPSMTRRSTLKQVAVRAGVSYQTISKVLNHKVKVSKETEQRIIEAVDALGYRPNLNARSLRSQRSNLIGYSWVPAPPDQANTILDLFLQSMSQAAESAGYHLLTFSYRSGQEWIDLHRNLIDTNRVDGFILSSIEYDDPRILFLQEHGFPFVAFGRSNPGWDFPYVDVDGGAGIEMVVDHLVELGHKKFAALAWPESSRVGQNRMEGLHRGLRKAGISPEECSIAIGDGVYEFGFEATRRLLDGPPENRPTAIVAFNDAMAMGSMKAIQVAGLQVGSDIAVSGYDDLPMIQYLRPSLTSVRQPVWEIGKIAISILLDILNEGECKQDHILLPPKLIVRKSTTG